MPASGGGGTRWDERYAEGDWVDAAAPAAIVADAAPWLTGPDGPGLALDLACGAGRNALFLAERGWRVLAVDLSREGLRRLGARAREGGPGRPGGESGGSPIQAVLADLARFGVRPDAFDLVVNTHFLLRAAFPLVREALRPGGLLLFETYSVLEIEALGGDIRRAFALERGELLRAFGDFEVLLHEEGVFEREEGERGLARLIARKPRARHPDPAQPPPVGPPGPPSGGSAPSSSESTSIPRPASARLRQA